MRAIVQRVSRASVAVDGATIGSIGEGLCVLLGITHSDGQANAAKMARKIAELKILRTQGGGEDERAGAVEIGAPILLISQFTLYADVRKGRKPSWSHAAPGDIAEPLVDAVAEELRQAYGLRVETGQFGAMMQVELVNDGPFTIFIET